MSTCQLSSRMSDWHHGWKQSRGSLIASLNAFRPRGVQQAGNCANSRDVWSRMSSWAAGSKPATRVPGSSSRNRRKGHVDTIPQMRLKRMAEVGSTAFQTSRYITDDSHEWYAKNACHKSGPVLGSRCSKLK
eukprot:7590558-Alexandrium_andersonii.AAC.1